MTKNSDFVKVKTKPLGARWGTDLYVRAKSAAAEDGLALGRVKDDDR